MKVTPTAIPDVLLIDPKVHGDARGFFMEVYESRDYAEAGIRATFVQDNHSGSRKGTLRGLHYQVRQPQGKLIRVVRGAAYDVAVDLRRSSPHFGQWVGATLSEENRSQLWIPPGFAHGFYVVTDWCEMIYKVTDFWAPEAERTVAWNDADLGIAWPIEPGQAPLLSSRDARGTPFREAETL